MSSTCEVSVIFVERKRNILFWFVCFFKSDLHLNAASFCCPHGIFNGIVGEGVCKLQHKDNRKLKRSKEGTSVYTDHQSATQNQ